MSTVNRPVRSYLFVPANRPERFDKAVASGADALILDLEDSVPPAEKESARHAVLAWMNARQSDAPERPQIWVRVNALDSQFHTGDIVLMAYIRPTGIVLPKCKGAKDLVDVDNELEALENNMERYRERYGERFGYSVREGEREGEGPHEREGEREGEDEDEDEGTRERERLKVIVIATETASAMLRIYTMDAPHPRLAGVLWGAEDLAASLGVRSLRDAQGNYLSPAIWARDAALMASHACSANAIDAVYTRLDDAEGLAAETRAHAALGFTAKAAIHPAQIAVIHAALAPSDDDLAWAQEVVDALQDGAISSGRLRGSMVDQPHLSAARRILALR